MKILKKIEFASTKLNHEEMKSIKAGYYGAYTCNVESSGGSSSCSSYASSCMTANGNIGYCVMTIIFNPYTISCACE
jgi:hypothetical protein